MIQSKAQQRMKNSRTVWQAVITVLVSLLLVMPPAWAAAICHCPPETRHVCCQTKQSDKLSENKHEKQAYLARALHCKKTPSPRTNLQVGKSSQYTMSCCEETPQRKAENAEFTASVTIGVEENSPPPMYSYREILTAPSFIPNQPRQQQRPLYLALSCWLI